MQLKRLYSMEQELKDLCTMSDTDNVVEMPVSYLISVIRERVSFYGIFMLYERVNQLFRKMEKLDMLEDQVNKLRAENQYLKYKIRYGNSLSEFFTEKSGSFSVSKKFGKVQKGGISNARRSKKFN